MKDKWKKNLELQARIPVLKTKGKKRFFSESHKSTGFKFHCTFFANLCRTTGVVISVRLIVKQQILWNTGCRRSELLSDSLLIDSRLSKRKKRKKKNETKIKKRLLFLYPIFKERIASSPFIMMVFLFQVF